MSSIIPSRQARRVVVLAVTVVAAACDAGATTAPGGTRAALAGSPAASRDVDLGSCSNLAAPAGAKVSAHYYATGTQNYWWSGTGWVFVGPTAELFADAGLHGAVGIHYSGPTWVSKSGSGVVGIIAQRCTPDASAIQWLGLNAVSSRGPGIFEGTTFIQRINTTGGLVPTAPGTYFGENVRVPYTAEYVFYR
ncbi:MAG: DUF3455 domain-containing protein [Gemmatimonadaceae bacterium]